MENWSIKGTYFESCNCDSACPCIFLSKPTEDICQGVAAWHIDRGEYKGLQLDDLNVSLMYYSEGAMHEGDCKGALYLDSRVGEQQAEAITNIFGGQAGGFFGEVAQIFGEILGVKKASMEFKVNRKGKTFKMDGIAEVEIESSEGPEGADITISNAPLALSPSYPVVVGKSIKNIFDDYGYQWEMSGKNALSAPFYYHD